MSEISQRLRLLREESDNLSSMLRDGSLDPDDFSTVIGMVLSDVDSLAASVEPPQGCPGWCNDHATHLELDGSIDSRHRFRVDLLGDFLEVEDQGEEGLRMWLPAITDLTLEQARELAAAIVATCDAVAGLAER